MASKIWLTDIAAPTLVTTGGQTNRLASFTPGTASQNTDATLTAVGPANVNYLVGGNTLVFYTEIVQTDVTLSGTATFNVRGSETAAQANAGPRIELIEASIDGTLGASLLASASAIEYGTTDGQVQWTAAPSGTLHANKRLAIRVSISDAGGTMTASGRSSTMSYGGATAGAAGETWISLVETVILSPSLFPSSAWLIA